MMPYSWVCGKRDHGVTPLQLNAWLVLKPKLPACSPVSLSLQEPKLGFSVIP